MTSSTRATTVRFTPDQIEWLRKRSFDLNLPQQLIIEQALAQAGMPRGASAWPGDVVTSLPLPDGVKDLIDAQGGIWDRSVPKGWRRQVLDGDRLVLDRNFVSPAEMVRDYKPLKVGKIRGQ
jgi:hypothetical protein